MPFSQLKLPLAVAIGTFSWACAFISIRAAVAHLSPAHVALARYLVASLILLPLWLWRRPTIAARDLPLIFVMGLCGFTFYNLALGAGETDITGGAAALIASTIPIFTTLGAVLFLGERVPRAAWAGIWVSLGGVFLIALGEKGGLGFSSGAILVTLAALFSAAYGLLQKRMVTRYHALDLTTAAIWCGTLALLPFGNGLLTEMRAAPLSAQLNVIFLGVFPGAIGYVLWSYALSKLPVARLMSFLYLVPAISIALGWIFLREWPATISLLGGAIALGGVVWTNWRKNERLEREILR
ncbi:MAG: DMT family transporter [Armatimonadetes bacterium]|nr:DMT family transporter [Armatimonadota bacterium]